PSVSSTPLLLMAGVLFWVAGFDVLYSCQDTDFDRSIGIHSVPARVGIPKALSLARVAHVISFVCFALVGTSAALGMIYFVGLLPIGALLAYQHTLVSPQDLSRINRAFFTVNGFVSVAYLALVAIAY
ncbi:MAG: UbiA family prenyltransferase, partial [Deltaproteobacteria bacterium]|nr:UbiA family prenyltransferase [Deltaproteobacteria bacterium]